MKPIQVKQRRFEQPKAIMALDDAEMVFTLVDLAETTALADTRSAPVAPAKQLQTAVLSPDALCEIRSAACLVLDREEAEALQRELDQALRLYRPIKAA